MLKLKVKRLNEAAKLPEVAHPGEDLGYDVFSCLPEGDVEIKPGERKLIPIGWAMEHYGWIISEYVDQFVMGKIVKKQAFGIGLIAKEPSGVAWKRGLAVHAGVVDAGWRGPVQVLLHNFGSETQVIKHHDKVAQLVPVPVFGGLVEEVDELSDSNRGEHGWGSGHKDAGK